MINSGTNNPVIISGINPTVGILTLGSGTSLNGANGQVPGLLAGLAYGIRRKKQAKQAAA